MPRDPGIPGTESPPAISKQTGSQRISRNESVPNFRAAKKSDSETAATGSFGRARSANEAADTEAHPDSAVPRIQKSLSRKISRAVLPKRSVSDNRETAETRSTVQRPKSPRSRSASSAQSRAQYANKNTPVPEAPSVPSAENPIPPRPSTRQETMKDQITHFFKTDRVADAWENTEKQGKRLLRRSSLKRMDGPLSIFRPRSSAALRTSQRPQTASFENDLGRQMWLQEETQSLSTYSLKPKREFAPRIHVLSVTEELEEDEEANDDNTREIETAKGDAESIITALPSFPLPPVRIAFLTDTLDEEAYSQQIREARGASQSSSLSS